MCCARRALAAPTGCALPPRLPRQPHANRRQVIKADGTRGLVPLSYVSIEEDEDDDGDALSLAGGRGGGGAESSVAGGGGAGATAGAAAAPSDADYNSFLRGCGRAAPAGLPLPARCGPLCRHHSRAACTAPQVEHAPAHAAAQHRGQRGVVDAQQHAQARARQVRLCRAGCLPSPCLPAACAHAHARAKPARCCPPAVAARPPRARAPNRSRYADDVDDPAAEPVDALAMGRMMALVAQQGGELDTALEQVDELDGVTRAGGTFNQPQYLHLKESLAGVVGHLDALQVVPRQRRPALRPACCAALCRAALC